MLLTCLNVSVFSVSLVLALSCIVFPSLFVPHFNPLGVHPLLDKGEGDSRLLVPTTSNEGTALQPGEEDVDEILDNADKFDEDVDIDTAIEDDTYCW